MKIRKPDYYAQKQELEYARQETIRRLNYVDAELASLRAELEARRGKPIPKYLEKKVEKARRDYRSLHLNLTSMNGTAAKFGISA